MLIDTHAHVNSEKFAGETELIIENAERAGLDAIINFGDTMEASFECLQLARKYDICYAGVGVHPEEAFLLGDEELACLAEWSKDPKVVAIG